MKKIQLTISSNKKIMGGTWCIDGTRIPIRTLANTLDQGFSPTQIWKEIYPYLKGKLKFI